MTSSKQQQTLTHEDRTTGRIATIGLLIVLALLFASVRVLNAQDAQPRGAIRPFVGAYIPTGDQRDFLKDAVLVGAQASWDVHQNLGLTASFGWAPAKDRVTAGDQTLDAFQYDLGIEGRAPQWIGTSTVAPFIGAGLGARTYRYRDLDVDARSNVAGFGAIGVDLDLGPLGVRVEGRDYVSQFKPLTGAGETKTRNDVALLAGLAFRF
jgi:hypothetical protein